MSFDQLGQLIKKLEAMSPLPDDNTVSQQTLETYEQIIDELFSVKDTRVIQPLINSFGYGDGYGLYSSVVTLLENFDYQAVKPYLIQAVQKGEPGSRMWAAQMLGRARDEDARPYLSELLNDPAELVQSFAASALKKLDTTFVQQPVGYTSGLNK